MPDIEKNEKLEELVNRYLAGNNLNSAIKAINDLSNASTRNNLYAKVSDKALEASDRATAIDAADKMLFSDARDIVLENIIKKSTIEQAFEIASSPIFKDPYIKNHLLEEIGSVYLGKNDLIKALEVSKHLDSSSKVVLLSNISTAYVENGDLEKAVEIANMISIKHHRDDIITTIAKQYALRSDFQETITDFCTRQIDPSEDDLLRKIITAYILQNTPIKALIAVLNVQGVFFPDTKDVLIEEIINHFCKARQFEEAKLAVINVNDQIKKIMLNKLISDWELS